MYMVKGMRNKTYRHHKTYYAGRLTPEAFPKTGTKKSGLLPNTPKGCRAVRSASLADTQSVPGSAVLRDGTHEVCRVVPCFATAHTKCAG